MVLETVAKKLKTFLTMLKLVNKINFKFIINFRVLSVFVPVLNVEFLKILILFKGMIHSFKEVDLQKKSSLFSSLNQLFLKRMNHTFK